MNKKKQISSILKLSKTLFDIFNYHLINNPNQEIFFEKNNFWKSRTFLESSKRIRKIINFFF